VWRSRANAPQKALDDLILAGRLQLWWANVRGDLASLSVYFTAALACFVWDWHGAVQKNQADGLSTYGTHLVLGGIVGVFGILVGVIFTRGEARARRLQDELDQLEKTRSEL
jgi:hypothetical protein